ncbi:MAG: Flp family type IVb pilin [Actinomycetota bacterium]
MTNLLRSFGQALGAIRARLRREEGASAVEYGMLVALIAAVIVSVVVLLGPMIAGAFQAIVDALTGAGVTPPGP